jgi:hypothetical protein
MSPWFGDVGSRLVTVARVMVPEVKCELPVDLYEYVLVQTKYVLFTPSTYLVRTIFPVYVRGHGTTYWYVLVLPVCLQKYCSGWHWMLFSVVCLWETIQCVRDMYAVVLQY